MHILLIHQAFAALDEAGGTRHYELSQYLASKGHMVTIIASPVSYITGKSKNNRIKWLEKSYPETGITILRTYTYPALHRSFVHRIISFFSFMISSFLVGLNVRHIDLVWGTSPPIFQGFSAWLISALKRRPFLFEVRDLWPAFAIGVGVLKNPILIKASLWLEEFLYQKADRTIVNSPGYIQHVTEKGAKNVELIPNGADLDMFQYSDPNEALIRTYDLDGKFIVLYAGAHGLSNDLDVVLNAANLLQQINEIVFLFVGDGKEKEHLQQRVISMQLGNVLFVPAVSKMEMPGVLQAANVCIAILKPLDLYKTTYPNKVFDYMAASRPIVLAIDGEIRKVVEDAGAGIFVSPGNHHEMAEAIMVLFNDRELCLRMGYSGRQYIETYFDRRKLAEQLVSLIEKMVNK